MGKAMLRIQLWGTRGSIPVSGPQYARFGGATTCVEVRNSGATGATPPVVVFDCGTGLANLGRQWGDRGNNALFLQTHVHWDHIQGFPFFGPLWNPAARYQFLAAERGGKTLHDALVSQMQQPMLPFTIDMLPCKMEFETIATQGDRHFGELRVRWLEVGHPLGCSSFRLDVGGEAVVFATDIELIDTDRAAFLAHCAGADVLIMDSQYFAEEYAGKRGFGHSTINDCVDVAREAGVDRLVLTHHDPAHDDDTLDRKRVVAKELAGDDVAVIVAAEGDVVDV